MFTKFKNKLGKEYEIPNYILEDFEYDFSPCPRCGSKHVEHTNYRDLGVLDWMIICLSCDLDTFSYQSLAFIPDDKEDEKFHIEHYNYLVKKYNQWCEGNPKSWPDEGYWTHYKEL